MSNRLQELASEATFRSLLVLDDIILKSIGRDSYVHKANKFAGDGSAVYQAWENRLTRHLIGSYHSLGKRAIKKVMALLDKKKRPTPNTIKQIDAIIEHEFNEWANDPVHRKKFFTTTQESYSKGLKQGVERVVGIRDKLPIHTIDPDRTIGTPVTKSEYIQKASQLAGLGAMSFADQDAIDTLANQQAFWMGDFYPGEFQQGLKDNAREILLESGLDKQEANKEFRTFLDGQFGSTPGVPTGWKGHPDDYFRNLAGNVVTVARAHGTMRAFGRLGVTTYTIINPEDESTCETCFKMTTETFSVSAAIERMDEQVQAKTKEQAKEIHPWLSWKDVKSDSAAELQAKGFAYPPFHYACRCSVEISDDALMEPASAQPSVEPVTKPTRRVGVPDHGDLERLDMGDTKGLFEKHHYKDSRGNTWMFKPDPAANPLSGAEVSVSNLARVLGHQSTEVYKYTLKVHGKSRTGSLQLMYKNLASYDVETQVEGMLGRPTKAPKFMWTKKQTRQIQKEHIWDFFIGNIDNHASNTMIDSKGKLLFIDKGLAMWPMPKSDQNLSSWTRSLPGATIYNPMYMAKYAKMEGSDGKFSKYSKVKPLVDAVDKMPDEQYLTSMGDWIDSEVSKGANREKLIGGLLEHKHTFASRVESFYKDQGLMD